jgi:hypothetical protein
MSLLGLNGGLLGTRRVPTQLAATGIWLPDEQSIAQRDLIWPSTSDIYFSSVSLLLHMDGSNGSTVFTDNSPAPRAITSAGNAQISTAQSKFGGASGYFNGTSDSLTFADPALGASDFTIEMWVKTNSSVQYAQLIGNEISGSGYTLLINNSSSTGGQVALYISGGFVVSTITGDWSDDAWHHIALTRSGNSFTIYTDGSSNGTGSSSASMNGGATAYVARNNLYPPRNLVGHIDELRITKGVVRYRPSPITVPTEPFPDASLEIDPFRSSVSLLLSGNGTNGSTSIIDSSSSPKTVAVFGAAQISTAQSKYGTSSIFLNGGYLTVPLTSAFQFGSNDFTIEGWFYPTATGGFKTVLGNYQSYNYTATALFASTSANTIKWQFMDNGTYPPSIVSSTDVALNAWTFIAVVRKGNALTLYVNGVPENTRNVSGQFLDGNGPSIWIGTAGDAPNSTQFYGYIKDLRVTKGIARYESLPFAVPTAPFPDAGPTFDPFRSSVSLLLHMDGSNGSTVFTDSSSNARTITANGNAQISTAQSKFGGASGYFDGNGDYLSATQNAAYAFGTGDFTVEAWIYPTSFAATYQTIAATRGLAGVSTGWSWSLVSNGSLILYTNGFAYTGTVTGAVTLNAWSHIAMVRSSGNFQVYVNGTANRSSSVALTNDFTLQTFWAGIIGGDASGEPFNGYIDELRITKAARYNRNFTPSTTPFPDS